MTATSEKLRQVIADTFGTRVPAVKPEDHLSTLGLDSLDVVELEMACETAFGFLFAPDLSDGFGPNPSIADVIATIDQRVAASKETVTL